MYMIFDSLWTLPRYINIDSKGAIILVSHDIEGSIVHMYQGICIFCDCAIIANYLYIIYRFERKNDAVKS